MWFFDIFYYVCLIEHVFKLEIKTMTVIFFKYHDLSTSIYKILIKNEKIIISLNVYLVNENKCVIFNELSLTLTVK